MALAVVLLFVCVCVWRLAQGHICLQCGTHNGQQSDGKYSMESSGMDVRCKPINEIASTRNDLPCHKFIMHVNVDVGVDMFYAADCI